MRLPKVAAMPSRFPGAGALRSSGMKAGFPLSATSARTRAVLLLPALAAAGLIASYQRDPGAGRWDDQEQRFEGVLIIHPYPMLQLNDGTTLLLVAEGKHAVTVPQALAEGRHVAGKGT